MQKQMEAVLVCCKYYDFIVNFHYANYDYVTENLIDAYQEFLFTIDYDDKKTLAMAVQLDHVMQVYLTTKRFYEMVQNYYMKDSAIVNDDIMDIVALYHDYIKEEMMTISSSKWI